MKILSSFQQDSQLKYTFSESGNYTIVVTVQNQYQVKSNTSIQIIVLNTQFNVTQVISSIQNSIKYVAIRWF